MSTVAMALRQASYNNKTFWRNPVSAFFTFGFPLMFLVIFNVAFGNGSVEINGGEIDIATFYVPAIITFSVINACYTNIAESVVFVRDRGLLKRARGTPLPASALIMGRVLQAIWVAVILVVLVLGFGAVFYSVDLPAADRLPAFFLALAIGAGTFCALGLAVISFVPNADAAPAVINATILPLLFISDVFIPSEHAPGWLNDIASIFPVYQMSVALHDVFNPFTTGDALHLKPLVVMLAWAALGVFLALRYFTWEPRK